MLPCHVEFCSRLFVRFSKPDTSMLGEGDSVFPMAAMVLGLASMVSASFLVVPGSVGEAAKFGQVAMHGAVGAVAALGTLEDGLGDL